MLNYKVKCEKLFVCNQEIPLTDNLRIPFKTNNNPSAELIPTLSLILSHSMILFIFIMIRITKRILNETTRPTNEETTRDGNKLKCKIIINNKDDAKDGLLSKKKVKPGTETLQ